MVLRIALQKTLPLSIWLYEEKALTLGTLRHDQVNDLIQSLK